MSTAAIRFKVMPSSPDVDLEKLKADLKEATETFESGVFSEVEEQPIAFGLVALIITIALSESEESDAVENKFSGVENVSSVELIDYRRAVG